MEVGKLNAQVRTGIGTGAVRKLRGGGKIPAICYGAGADPIPLALDPNELQKALDPVKGRNTLLHIKIEGMAGGTIELPVMLKDVQHDGLRGTVRHADFVRVSTDHPVKVTVPIVLLGKSEGVKAGGILHQVYRTLPVLCSPDKIPAKIEVDTSALAIGQSIHVSDLKLADGISAALSAGTTICVVTAPKAEKAVETTEVAGVEAAAPEAGDAKKDDKAGGKAAPAKAAPAKAAPAKAAPAKGK